MVLYIQIEEEYSQYDVLFSYNFENYAEKLNVHSNFLAFLFNEVRKKFLDFFVSKGHMIEPGVSLVPINDPTLLWINAGVSGLKKYFDGRVIWNYETEEAEDGSYLYNTILGLVVIVSMAAALNFCALYHYIITTRRRTLAIFRICGLTCRQCIRLYLGECTVLSVGTYLVTVCFFRYFLMPALAAKNNVFDFHYKPKVYLVLFLL